MANITWTKEQIEFLIREYYNYTNEELAEMLGKTKPSVRAKHSMLLKEQRLKGTNKKKIAELSRCPECKKLINKVEGGYFCRYCLKEFDRYGEFMPPLSVNA